jgi:hypothetical protein
MAETWTPAKFAREAGIDRHVMTERLASAKIRPVGKARGRASGGDLYHFRDLFNAALGGDIEAERLRKTREEADLLAIKKARMQGELVDVGDVKKVGMAVFARVRAKVLSSTLLDSEKDALLRDLLTLKDHDWATETQSAD